jgi:hypothetical protein
MSKQTKRGAAAPEAVVAAEILHVVFQEADIEVLQQAIALDENMQGEIVIIRDDFAVGPLDKLDEAEGWQARREWWLHLLQHSPYVDRIDMVNDRLAVHNLKKALDEDENLALWIWMGQNSHDVCSYFWLIEQIKEYSGRIFVLYMNNLPFINERGGIFYPANIHEIPAKEFRKAKKLARTVTPSEFEIDGDEWRRLAGENAMVRILEGGKKISSQRDDFYDADLLKVITGEWQKVSKVLFNALGKMKLKTGDVFLNYRLHQMAAAGLLEMQGDAAKGWKEASIRLLGVTTSVTSASKEVQTETT